MGNTVKTNAIKHLRKINAEVDAILALEGSITEFKELPRSFVENISDLRSNSDWLLGLLNAPSEEE